MNLEDSIPPNLKKLLEQKEKLLEQKDSEIKRLLEQKDSENMQLKCRIEALEALSKQEAYEVQ